MSAHTGSPGSTASLRAANQQRVVDLLRSGRVLTQSEIARGTGLAPATVSNIVRDLASAGLVSTEPGSGRRGTTVQLSRGAGLVAGIDFGHSHVAVALGDLTGTVLAEARVALAPDHPHEQGLDRALELFDRLVAGQGVDAHDVRTVGMGLPAPLAGGVVQSSAILPGWVGVNAVEAARARLGRDVHLDNDANLGALAEHRFGVARGRDSSVFVKVSSGVGAGIIVQGQLFHGSAGTAGELGHLTLDEAGPVCRCGSRGCLEAYTSSSSLQGLMRGQMPGAEVDEIVAAAREGNVSALRALEDAGLHLGWALASVVNLINPALIVVGGDLARAGELLLGPARIGLRRHALDAVAATPVLASELGERASLTGAVLLAAEHTAVVA